MIHYESTVRRSRNARHTASCFSRPSSPNVLLNDCAISLCKGPRAPIQSSLSVSTSTSASISPPESPTIRPPIYNNNFLQPHRGSLRPSSTRRRLSRRSDRGSAADLHASWKSPETSHAGTSGSIPPSPQDQLRPMHKSHHLSPADSELFRLYTTPGGRSSQANSPSSFCNAADEEEYWRASSDRVLIKPNPLPPPSLDGSDAERWRPYSSLGPSMGYRQSDEDRGGTASTSSLHKRIVKTKMCVHHTHGRCARGSGCTFAHSASELREPPDLYKTRLCINFGNFGRCQKGEECRFAHGIEELRVPEEDRQCCPTALGGTKPKVGKVSCLHPFARPTSGDEALRSERSRRSSERRPSEISSECNVAAVERGHMDPHGSTRMNSSSVVNALLNMPKQAQQMVVDELICRWADGDSSNASQDGAASGGSTGARRSDWMDQRRPNVLQDALQSIRSGGLPRTELNLWVGDTSNNGAAELDCDQSLSEPRGLQQSSQEAENFGVRGGIKHSSRSRSNSAHDRKPDCVDQHSTGEAAGSLRECASSLMTAEDSFSDIRTASSNAMSPPGASSWRALHRSQSDSLQLTPGKPSKSVDDAVMTLKRMTIPTDLELSRAMSLDNLEKFSDLGRMLQESLCGYESAFDSSRSNDDFHAHHSSEQLIMSLLSDGGQQQRAGWCVGEDGQSLEHEPEFSAQEAVRMLYSEALLPELQDSGSRGSLMLSGDGRVDDSYISMNVNDEFRLSTSEVDSTQWSRELEGASTLMKMLSVPINTL